MKIETSTVKKITVTDIKNLDPVAIYLEDFGSGSGKIVITCFDKSWSYYWGAMGERNLTNFFMSCDNWYLSKKLNPNIPSNINDEDELEKEAKKRIIERRKEDSISQDEARGLYDDCPNLLAYKDSDSQMYSDVMYEIFGDEWWDSLPTKPNPEYMYFHKILDVVKEALKMETKCETV